MEIKRAQLQKGFKPSSFGNKMRYGKTFKKSLLITSLGSITSPFINRGHLILDKPSLNTSLELSCDNSFNSGSFSSFNNISWGGDFTFGLQKIVRIFNPLKELDQKKRRKKKSLLNDCKMNFRCWETCTLHNIDLIRCPIYLPAPFYNSHPTVN